MARRISYRQVKDGEWFSVPDGHLNKCCDCGLVHRYRARVGSDGVIELQAIRDKRATAAARRAAKVAA